MLETVQRSTRHSSRRAWPSAALLVLALAACSSDTGILPASDSAAPPKRDLGLTRDWNLFAKDDPRGRSIQATDLVGPDGRCAGDVASPVLNFQAGPEVSPQTARPGTAPRAPATAPTTRGIALEMTECDVVRISGYTDRVEVSSNERGQRLVVLTYPQGDHAGIYRFENGRLKSIERTPEMAAPAKPSKPKKAASKDMPKN